MGVTIALQDYAYPKDLGKGDSACANLLTAELKDLQFRDEAIDDLFVDTSKKYPDLYRNLNSPALKRWRRSKEAGWQVLFEKLTQCTPGKYCDIVIDSNTFSIKVAVEIKNNVLNIEIRAFRARVYDPKTNTSTVIQESTRPAHLSPAFSYLWGVLLDSGREIIHTHPELTMIRVKGVSVVNDHLHQIFKKQGFKITQTVHSPPAARGYAFLVTDWTVELPVKR